MSDQLPVPVEYGPPIPPRLGAVARDLSDVVRIIGQAHAATMDMVVSIRRVRALLGE